MRPRIAMTLMLLSVVTTALAGTLREGQPLPDSRIDDLGELVLDQDAFVFQRWDSRRTISKPHVLQYFPGTLRDSKLYEPFTDQLQAQYALGTYHVTTIINLKEALWGTRGFVVSELKRNKRKFPDATIVLDEAGMLAGQWALGEKGAGLIIVDADGEIRHVHLGQMDKAQLAAAEAVFAELMSGAEPIH